MKPDAAGAKVCLNGTKDLKGDTDVSADAVTLRIQVLSVCAYVCSCWNVQ